MSRSTPGGKLRLHRETLRVLAASDLRDVAGGTLTMELSFTEQERDQNETRPKTNGWGLHAEVVCVAGG